VQLFPSQGFSQGGVLVTIEISNLADIPATAKDYSCIFKISSVSKQRQLSLSFYCTMKSIYKSCCSVPFTPSWRV
jgi:hypothetical protein